MTVLEPALKALLSNRGLLPLLWKRRQGHPNLLASVFESDPAHASLGDHYVRKPLFSREGANISIVEGALREEGLDAGYARAVTSVRRCTRRRCSTASM